MLEWAVISYRYDLKDPSGSRVQVGIAEVRDNKKVEGFWWIRNLSILGLGSKALDQFSVYPQKIKDKIEREGLKETCAKAGLTSLYISDSIPIEYEGPVAVFGDAHGNHTRLKLLLKKLNAQHEGIPIFTTGDLIDRGPNSKAVIDTCIKNGIRGVLGNHDQWLHQYISGFGFDSFALSPAMDGQATIRSYGVEDCRQEAVEEDLYRHIPEAHHAWVYNMLPYQKIIVGGHTYWLIHAGLGIPDIQRYWSEFKGTEDDFMAFLCRRTQGIFQWGHIEHLPDGVFQFPSGATIVMGHRVKRDPIVAPHVICLDTGCGLPWGRLTAVILPSGETLSE